ncbi:hypothetical protein CC1G_11680 [Coprinopsis cinerea okayama7|uniref:Uncharacterized protein n=1 Tax=Coprinopsis cinerea (strain Okayama-7 / 130 / ATCC MYA-4618 / FGSC 9003) TaxID=240176 RepID=A8P3U4_COPC7|nr:hypothetical protein CC1G_11680 [Coprinopsis cinerea okayama7\|eukprot:XP_001838618.2 hypothetical protein CC1G_11680 [Coprinopsis cinerea okayama7\
MPTSFQRYDTSAKETDDEASPYALKISQVALLKSKLDTYRDLKGKARKRFAHKLAQILRNEIQDLSGTAMPQAKHEALKRAVTEWFKQNVQRIRGNGKRMWGIRWHGRLVFQYERTRAILHIARLLVDNAPLPDLRGLIDQEERILPSETKEFQWIPDDDEEEDEEGAGNLDVLEEEEEEVEEEEEEGEGSTSRDGKLGVSKKPSKAPMPKAFHKYQTATTLLWETLTDDERHYYHTTAEKWRSQGPPLAEQRRAAERFISSRCLDFATALLNDMNARVYMLVGYEDTKGDAYGIQYDFTKELRGGEAFKKVYKKELQESGILDYWGDYVGNLYNRDVVNQEGPTTKARRSHSKPLVPLPVDKWGVPSLPPLSQMPKGEQTSVWLCDVLRSFFTRHYARGSQPLPSRVGPHSYSRVPWKAIRTNIRRCIDQEYLPDDLAEIWNDPSQLDLDKRLKLYSFYLARQNDPTVDIVFEFSHLPSRGGKTFHPRKYSLETVVSPDSDDDGDYGYKDVSRFVPPRPRPTPSPSKLKSKTGKKGDTKRVTFDTGSTGSKKAKKTKLSYLEVSDNDSLNGTVRFSDSSLSDCEGFGGPRQTSTTSQLSDCEAFGETSPQLSDCEALGQPSHSRPPSPELSDCDAFGDDGASVAAQLSDCDAFGDDGATVAAQLSDCDAFGDDGASVAAQLSDCDAFGDDGADVDLSHDGPELEETTVGLPATELSDCDGFQDEVSVNSSEEEVDDTLPDPNRQQLPPPKSPRRLAVPVVLIENSPRTPRTRSRAAKERAQSEVRRSGRVEKLESLKRKRELGEGSRTGGPESSKRTKTTKPASGVAAPKRIAKGRGGPVSRRGSGRTRK